MAGSSEKTIFLQATELDNDAERLEYLESACAGNTELRAAVDSLLAAHDHPTNPLDKSPFASTPNPADQLLSGTVIVDESDANPQIGTTIDAYRLMEQIGEGGFGLVFVAQQDKPVKRKVALKIIKPGTGSKEVLARFAAERQAVAMMDHPNIAQVFDAGVTADGRPYFVMELVRGEPVTNFCSRHNLQLRERLNVFQDICAATHHAHQKGVIHRDLKPSNVMVTLHDDKPVVKVIDFGVAKAMGDNLADETIYTRFYSIVGTPLYMSPEQAAMSGLDVDTRSDIYSLGVLLYELLTGTTPFERERLDTAGYDEMRRIIREEEPPRPSTRLTDLQTLPVSTLKGGATLSGPHDVPRQLSHESIPGDLDWIVMKALDKNRTRRYESAAAMSADIRRFLNSEPIEARPPSRGYRLAKFAKRNRVALFTGSLVFGTLLLGTAISVHQAVQAIDARNEKEEALAEALAAKNRLQAFAGNLKTANVLLARGRTYENEQQFSEADAAYSEAVELVPNYYLLWHRRAILRAELNLWEEAAEDFSQAIQLEAPIEDQQWEGAATLFHLTNRHNDYRTIYERMLESVNAENHGAMHAIRSCLIAPQSDADIHRMVQCISELRIDSNGGGGPRDRERELERGRGPGRRPEEPMNRGRNGGPENRREGKERNGRADGPGPGPGGPGDSGGPTGRGPRRLPRSVEQYIAGWAHVRGGNYARALAFLNAVSDSRGPSRHIAHSLRAIALQKLGRNDEAIAALKLADEGLNQLITDTLTPTWTQSPIHWIDLTDCVILHREATVLLTGNLPELDPRLRIAQLDARQLLGIR